MVKWGYMWLLHHFQPLHTFLREMGHLTRGFYHGSLVDGFWWMGPFWENLKFGVKSGQVKLPFSLVVFVVYFQLWWFLLLMNLKTVTVLWKSIFPFLISWGFLVVFLFFLFFLHIHHIYTFQIINISFYILISFQPLHSFSGRCISWPRRKPLLAKNNTKARLTFCQKTSWNLLWTN